MSDRDLTAVEILTGHLATLTADLERVLSEGAWGRYGPGTIQDAIADTVAHIATLTQGAFIPEVGRDMGCCRECQELTHDAHCRLAGTDNRGVEGRSREQWNRELARSTHPHRAGGPQ